LTKIKNIQLDFYKNQIQDCLKMCRICYSSDTNKSVQYHQIEAQHRIKKICFPTDSIFDTVFSTFGFYLICSRMREDSILQKKLMYRILNISCVFTILSSLSIEKSTCLTESSLFDLLRFLS
jgi:hypothetical protein